MDDIETKIKDKYNIDIQLRYEIGVLYFGYLNQKASMPIKTGEIIDIFDNVTRKMKLEDIKILQFEDLWINELPMNLLSKMKNLEELRLSGIEIFDVRVLKDKPLNILHIYDIGKVINADNYVELDNKMVEIVLASKKKNDKCLNLKIKFPQKLELLSLGGISLEKEMIENVNEISTWEYTKSDKCLNNEIIDMMDKICIHITGY